MSAGHNLGDNGSELRRRLRQHQLIAAFGTEALREPQLSALLDEAARTAAAGLGTELAKVLRHIPSEDSLLLAAGVGWAEGTVGVMKLGTDLASPAGFALRTGAPVISNHLGGEGRFRTPEVLVQHGVRRAVNVLIRGEGSAPPFGVLEADTTETDGEFSASDLDFLQSLANVIGLAIDRDRDRRDRELMTREAHHRVKNSLQIAQTLLRLQLRASQNAEARDQLEQAARRIMTIGAVHERLFSGPSIGQVVVADYLRGLLDDLQDTLGLAQGERRLTLELSEATKAAIWDGDRVTTLGLVATELITNAFKYGRGEVVVSLDVGASGGVDLLIVEDEGDGPGEGFDQASSQGLGMRILGTLLRGGGLVAERPPGQRFRFVATLAPVQ